MGDVTATVTTSPVLSAIGPSDEVARVGVNRFHKLSESGEVRLARFRSHSGRGGEGEIRLRRAIHHTAPPEQSREDPLNPSRSIRELVGRGHVELSHRRIGTLRS